MYIELYGQPVDCHIAYGNCHQVVREYDAGGHNNYRYPAGHTTLGLPWFHDFRKAVEWLMSKPWKGHVLTYVMEHDGSGPSWITNGVHFYKRDGHTDAFGPGGFLDAGSCAATGSAKACGDPTPDYEQLRASLKQLLEICRYKCGPRDEAILPGGKTNEMAMIEAMKALGEL